MRSNIMSTKKDEVEEVCASCGITGGDDIKLRSCNACKLVWYCSVACENENRLQHKDACSKRAAELRDELLFKQPEISHLGECPICCLPLPLDIRKFYQHACCSQIVCGGCIYANRLREMKESLKHKCPFCRTPVPGTDEEINQQSAKRVEANDPVAIYRKGARQYNEKNYSGASQLCIKAAGLGDAEAHFQLAAMHVKGRGVEKDEKKVIHYLEEAAIQGHPGARYNLGYHEGKEGRIERAVKHFLIGANLGHDDSLKELKDLFKHGLVKKEVLATALRAHKSAVDATKSTQREAANRIYNA